MRAPRSLPIPGSSRNCASVRRATGSAVVRTTSAADRYARILNAFSPLISSRSAISPRARATAALSTHEAFVFEAEVQDAGAAGRERRRDRLLAVRWPVAEEAAASAGAADLGGGGTRGAGTSNELVDEGCGDAGSQPPPVGPLLVDGRADPVPVTRDQRLAHARGGVADTLEAGKHLRVAVDVGLGDRPVVGARVVRLARIAQGDPARQLAQVDRE